MSNNIKLEIELTNKERGDSIIDDDIEKALDIKVEENKTLTPEEFFEVWLHKNEVHTYEDIPTTRSDTK